MSTEKKHVNPWSWVPSLYFAQGLPYVLVTTVAVIMFKRLGLSNGEIAFYTSWLGLPWMIKPLWSPLVEILKSKRWWIISMQILIGGGLAGVAFFLPGPQAIRSTLAFMWLLGFSSATHDIAIDGFYMSGLDKKKQAYFIGIRNTFYRLALIAGQGLLVMLAGYFEKHYSTRIPQEEAIPLAWAVTFYVPAAIFMLLAAYHNFILPRPANDRALVQENAPAKVAGTFFDTFADFFKKKHILSALAFILLYRFAESQLVKIASPFLLDTKESGGLALETGEVGMIYGTIGVAALIVGGILGGLAMARKGLKPWIGWMAIALNLPNVVYLFLALTQTQNILLISSCVAIEQFGYGFGFTSLTFFMMLFSSGKYQTAHYALCTGFMALGMMLPGMVSGWIQEQLGYQLFFAWIMLCTIPSFIVAKFVRISDPSET